MKQHSTPAAPTNTQAHSATLNQMVLQSPQRFSKRLALRQGGTLQTAPLADVVKTTKVGITTLERVAEVTIGTDPQLLIRRAVNLVSAGPLRSFLSSVMAQPRVNRVFPLPLYARPQ